MFKLLHKLFSKVCGDKAVAINKDDARMYEVFTSPINKSLNKLMGHYINKPDNAKFISEDKIRVMANEEVGDGIALTSISHQSVWIKDIYNNLSYENQDKLYKFAQKLLHRQEKPNESN